MSALLRSMLLLVVLLSIACGHGAVARKAESGPREGQSATPLAPDQVVLRTSDAAIVELRVVFEAGSADDPAGHEGLTYVTVRSMLEGGAGGLSYPERVAQLFPMAAEISGRVDREQIVLVGRVHLDHVAAFYPLFRDVILHPMFERPTFERVRERARASLMQGLRGGDDEQLGKELLQWMLFERQPLGHPALGLSRSLARLTASDLSAQWSRIICAGRVRVAAAGPISPELKEALLRDLSSLRRPECTTSREPTESPRPPRRMWIVEKPSASAVAISVGLPLDVRRGDPDYPALVLAAAYLGQHRTFAGRLMQKIRVDRGMNYGDYAYAEHFEEASGTRFPGPNVARSHQYFSLWLRPLAPEQAQFALRLAVRELSGLLERGMSEQDFARIREFALNYFALFEQTEQMRLGNALDDLFYCGGGRHLNRLLSAFRGLTAERVNEVVARRLKLDALQIAVVAPDGAAFVRQSLASDAATPVYASEKPAPIRDEDREVSRYSLRLSEDRTLVIPVEQVFQ